MIVWIVCYYFFFFFKQKTAYDMRISDWSSDVCSSDLLKDTINTMVDRLNSFASEVTRVAREVGTEGKLGGQAQVKGVAGTWKDLTDNVNMMATNLTNQVRGIADVVTAVAKGTRPRKLTGGAKGEIAALAESIHGII